MLVRIAAAVALLMACGCSREQKPDPFSALDNAYKSGLLTKQEYDAKHAALVAGADPASAPRATPAVPAPQASPVDTASGGGSGGEAGAAVAPPAVAIQPTSPKPAAPPPVHSARANPPPPAQPTPAPAPAPAVPAGCEDEEFKSGGQKEASRFYDVPPEEAWKAAVATLNSMDFNIDENTEKEIEATRRGHIGVVVGAGGEKVTLTFKKTTNQGRSGTMVTGETKKSFVGRLTQRTWTDAVLAQMACKLREGK